MRRKFIFFQNSKHIKSEQQNQGVNIVFVECIGRRDEKSKSQFRCLFSSNWKIHWSSIFFCRSSILLLLIFFRKVELFCCCLKWKSSKKVSKAAISSKASWLISYLSLSTQQLEHPEQLCELFELVFELFLELVVEEAPEPNSTSLGRWGLGKVLELPMVIAGSWTSLILKVRLRFTLAKLDNAANL